MNSRERSLACATGRKAEPPDVSGGGELPVLRLALEEDRVSDVRVWQDIRTICGKEETVYESELGPGIGCTSV